jgi:hypothetical protein
MSSMARRGGLVLGLFACHAVGELVTAAVGAPADAGDRLLTGSGEMPVAGGAVTSLPPLSETQTVSGATHRRLQADNLSLANATNTTSLYSECELAARAIVGVEQCEIAYRSNDCPGAATPNWVPWVDLAEGVYFCHIFGVLVMFMALSVVCDEFFVPGTRASLSPPPLPPQLRHLPPHCLPLRFALHRCLGWRFASYPAR